MREGETSVYDVVGLGENNIETPHGEDTYPKLVTKCVRTLRDAKLKCHGRQAQTEEAYLRIRRVAEAPYQGHTSLFGMFYRQPPYTKQTIT